MDIREIRASLPDADRTRAASARDAKNVSAVSRSESRDAEQASQANDRLNISESGRTASLSDVSAHELAFARKAMMEIPPLAEERIAEIHQRIKDGYYLQQEVSRKIAQKVSQNLTD